MTRLAKQLAEISNDYKNIILEYKSLKVKLIKELNRWGYYEGYTLTLVDMVPLEECSFSFVLDLYMDRKLEIQNEEYRIKYNAGRLGT